MEKRFALHTGQCRQCGKPMSTTNSRAVVHSECRAEYYKTKARVYQSRKLRVDIRERKKYFINECACEACGNKELTRIKKLYHPPAAPGQPAEKFSHTLCPNCFVKCRIGLMEPLTWKLLPAK